MDPNLEEKSVGGPDDEILDPVDEMGDESFPASDPPSGWAGEDPRDVEVSADGIDAAADAAG
ncbi:MAG TPA: hypothetical protein VIH95_10940 [Acidimicrobiales bacterium]